MKNKKFIQAVNNNRIKWNRHALERMMERDIMRAEVKFVLLSGELIEHYVEQKPFPGGLFLGWVDKKPYHVVASYDDESNTIYIITVYIPDLIHFEKDYKTRKNE